MATGIARTADIGPTILARLGLAPPIGIDGSDLAPLWSDGEVSDRVAYLESLATRFDHGWSPLHGVRTSRHLYVRAPRPELYRVGSDPGQQRNLLASPTAADLRRAEALARVLEQRLADDRLAPEQTLDDATREQLRALGYALPETPVVANDLDPKDGRRTLVLHNEGDILYEAGQFRAAAAKYEEMLALSPHSAEARISLGAAWLSAGELERALDATLRGLELLPGSAASWQQLGAVQMALGRLDDAAIALRRAIELDPRAPGAHIRLMQTLVAAGRREEAAAHDAWISAEPIGDAALLRRVADFWEAKGHSSMALAAYRRVLERAPDSRRDHMHLAIHLVRHDRMEEALDHLERAGDVASQPKARKALALAYLETGRKERARDLLSSLPLDEPDYDWAASALRALDRKDTPHG